MWSKGNKLRRQKTEFGNAVYIACHPLLCLRSRGGFVIIVWLIVLRMQHYKSLYAVRTLLFTLSAQHLYLWILSLPATPKTLWKYNCCIATLHIAVTHATSQPMQPASYANCEDMGQNLISQTHSIIIHNRCCHGNTSGMLINTHAHGQFQCISLQLYDPHKIIFVVLVAMVWHSTWPEYYYRHIVSYPDSTQLTGLVSQVQILGLAPEVYEWPINIAKQRLSQ